MTARKQVKANNLRLKILENRNLSWPKILLFGAGIFLLVILLIFWMLGFFRSKTNPEKLLEAMLRTSELSKMELYHEANVDSLKIEEGSDFFLSSFQNFLNDTGFTIQSKLDAKQSKSEIDFRFAIKGIETLDILFLQNKEERILSIPKLLAQSLYLSKDGILSLSNQTTIVSTKFWETILETMTIEKIEAAKKYYKPALNPFRLSSFKKLNEKKYLQRVLKFYDEHMTVEKNGFRKVTVPDKEYEIKGDVYTIEENLGESAEFYNQLILDLLRDDNFLPFMEEYLERIIATAEKNQDLVLYNTICILHDKENVRSIWDDEVKAELVFWKELILDKLETLKKEIEKPHFADLSGKWISALKESGSKVTSVFVVDRLVKYTHTEMTIHPGFFKDGSLPEKIGQEELKFHINTALLSQGETVRFRNFDPSHSLDYSKAKAEEIKKLFEDLEKNILNLFLSIKNLGSAR